MPDFISIFLLQISLKHVLLRTTSTTSKRMETRKHREDEVHNNHSGVMMVIIKNIQQFSLKSGEDGSVFHHKPDQVLSKFKDNRG